MKAIKNIDKNDIIMPFEGNTYTLSKGEALMVEEDLYEFLLERLPMSFDFKYKVEKDKPVAKVKSVKTPSFIPRGEQESTNADMKVSPPAYTTQLVADQTPPSGTTDADGVEWYGEGVQVEQAAA